MPTPMTPSAPIAIHWFIPWFLSSRGLGVLPH